MAIESVGNMNTILKNYDAKNWIKTSELGVQPGLDIAQTPKPQFENGEVQKTFGEFLSDSLSKVNQMQLEANDAVEKLASGESQNLHETMLKVEEAEIAFKSMNQIRNKVIEAYKEIMKMQI